MKLKKVKSWLWWKTSFILLLLTVGLMALGVNLDNEIIFLSCFIPFLFIFFWLYWVIKKDIKEVTEASKKFKENFTKCEECEKYVGVISISPIGHHKHKNFVSRIEAELSCGHKKRFRAWTKRNLKIWCTKQSLLIIKLLLQCFYQWDC